MSDLLQGKTPIKARHIRPGQGQAVEVKAGQLLQIQTLQGKQVADFVAFSLEDPEEFLSTSTTQSTNASIVPRQGMILYSNRRQAMFAIVADTVGRHDMLYACCDPVRYEQLGAPGHANCREALTDALSEHGIGIDRIPTPINWFMNVAILQRGELDIREPLAEKDDYVLLQALKDTIAAVSACPQDLTATNGFTPTDLRIRVFPADTIPAETVEQLLAGQAAETPPATDASERAAKRAARRAERRAARGEDAEESATAGAADPAEAPAAEAIAAGVEKDAAPKGNVSEGTPRPARLQDTAEATVLRVE